MNDPEPDERTEDREARLTLFAIRESVTRLDPKQHPMFFAALERVAAEKYHMTPVEAARITTKLKAWLREDGIIE